MSVINKLSTAIGKGWETPGRRRTRRNVRWVPPAAVVPLEERIVPAFTPLASQGFVQIVLPGTDGGSGFTVAPTSQICSTMQLTAAGIAQLQANSQDSDPNNDAIAVGLASYILLDGDSNSLHTQEFLDSASGELSLASQSVTLCVDSDDYLCTQVDDYTGTQPLDFTTTPVDLTRFLGGAIFSPGQFVTTDLNNLGDHICPDEHRGQQGLTLGYWKNHTSSWQYYTPDQKLGTIFAGLTEDLDPSTPGVQNPFQALANDTMLQALNYQGGPTIQDAARLMLKQAAAGLLNAINTGVNYPLTTGQIKVMVNNALESQDRATILSVASILEADNSLEGVTLSGPNTNKNSH